jgi:hypothetical protein
MPTTTYAKTYAKALADYTVFAPIGAGQLLVEKTRDLSTSIGQAAMAREADVLGAYRELAERGRALVKGVRKAPATRRAEAKIDAARIQVRDTVAGPKRRPRTAKKPG